MRVITLVAVAVFLGSMANANVEFWKRAWPNTDFSKTSVDFKEILDGGPGKDGIPAISAPQMRPISEHDGLADSEPVMVVALPGQAARAYPVRYLMWHEIVNDQSGGVPFAVTFCPLCNSGVVFDRRLEGKVYELGVSGLLRNSDMIMYDRQTQTWWQQFTGEAIVGDLTGKQLKKLPGWMESWADFVKANPNGLVQSEPKHRRRYGANPYAGYDTGRPFLYRGEDPPHGIKPLERVVVIGDKAWPLKRIAAQKTIREAGVVISWRAGTASALDSPSIAKGRDVGAVRVRDANTGKDVVHDVSFAFAFHAFHPDGTWYVDKAQ